MMQKINPQGLEIITSFEGFSTSPYKCPAGVWTIGYGATRQLDGSPVTIETPSINEDEAHEWLRLELEHTEKIVSRLVKVPLNGNQFSALVSFIYNIGSGNFAASTLRQKLNREDYEAAADEFPKWRRAGGVILKGLVRRRIAERQLFEA